MHVWSRALTVLVVATVFLATAAADDSRFQRVNVTFQVNDQVGRGLVGHHQPEQIQVFSVILVGDVFVVVGRKFIRFDKCLW